MSVYNKGFIGLIALLVVSGIIAILSVLAIQYYSNSVPIVSSIPTEIPLPKSLVNNSPSPSGEPKAEKIVTGTVMQNNLGCTMDGSCYLTIRTIDSTVRVVYGRENPPCISDAGKVGIALNVGEEVEIFGVETDENRISTCEKKEYFIKKT